MSGQQIDSLTVGVGLTQEDFQAGVQKILSSLENLRTETATVGESMTASMSSVGSSVLGLGLKFAGLFIAVRGIEDVVGYFKNLSVELANTAAAGEYLGQSSAAMRRFGEVAELAGGQSQDAITAVQGLQSAIFGLEFQGQMSQNLLMLQRLGVGYLDASGHMRDMKDIQFETARALQQQLPGDANKALRVQWAAQIFGAGGIANAVGAGLNELRKFYADAAKDQKGTTDRTLEEQRKLRQTMIQNSYEIASLATNILNGLTPAIQDLMKVIRNDLMPILNSIASFLNEVFMDHSQKNLAAAQAAARVKGGVIAHPGFFDRLLANRQIAAYNSTEAFAPTAFGGSQVVPSNLPEVVPWVGDWPTTFRALMALHSSMGGNAKDPNWQKTIAAYRAQVLGGGTPALHSLSTPSALRPVVITTPGGGKPTAGNAGPRVQIGQIGPIITQAKDADGLMAGINRAAARKLLVAQADPGLA